MKILVLTSLYPNSEQPRHGIFIEHRINQLKQHFPQLDITVVAPVPWFPFTHKGMGGYAAMARVPQKETRNGIDVYHPRYLTIPKIGMNIAPVLMALCLLPFLKKLQRNVFNFDLIDCHYFYPDGVAATWLAKKLKRPVTVTARGSDIHLLPNYSIPNRMIKWAIKHCTVALAVCKALADEMAILVNQQVTPVVARNGVNLIKFSPPENRQLLRQQLQLSRFTLLSVGNLIELKGHHLIIDAMCNIPEAELLIAGHGPLEASLKQQVKELNLQDRVRFLGLLTQDELVEYYGAADALVLASSREGWANVLLEAMACGTPVIATAIWGTPEVVASDKAGLLIQKRTASSIATAVATLQKSYPSREGVREYAEQFSWDETSHCLYQTYKQAINIGAQQP
ncbi:glycosyltransferase family 4 protein [Neptunicella marina]|uniref:Glycosyltransferase family 4 protein n=1 Tax=Neptunicella marina TaxID=2125989 RepID=A0A8J6ITZ2_9ALTE|nr:glycosyltransferase family 4 protein [Neptunicella marina]MBC3765762.1 glycosyltransferase family 4 protein [Neptunicella marina]